MIKITAPDASKINQKIRDAVSKLETKKFVTVGVHEDNNSRVKDERTNATVGAENQFGTSKTPARPWLDVGVASGKDVYTDIINKAGDDIDGSLDVIGNIAVGKVKEYMTDLRTPPNSPATIKKKKSDNPLIDTGSLRASITYKIVSTKPEEGIV